MKKYLIVLAAVMGMGFYTSAQAAGYGDAGCGLGSWWFDKNTISSQTLAGTTNAWSGQPFSITSGISNCTAKGFVMEDKKAQYFAEANFENLSVEMAKGHGESLAAFAQVMGCSDNSVVEFSSMTQKSYEKIFNSEATSAAEMLQNVKSEISSHPVLSKECSV